MNPHLESQIASIADDIAYNNHDIEDAIRAELINLDSLRELKYFNELIKQILFSFPNIDDKILGYQILRMSISQMINDIKNNSQKIIDEKNIQNYKDIKNNKNFIIVFSDEMKKYCVEIREYLYQNVYNYYSEL